MTTIRLPDDFKEFLKLLNSNEVRYLLIGGYAVGFYGYPRATADIHVWVEISERNASLIVESLKQFGFDVANLNRELFLKEHQIVRLGNPPLRIELLTSISGVGFEECYTERTRATIDGMNLPVISLTKLRMNKKASGRHKDLDDLEQLPEE